VQLPTSPCDTAVWGVDRLGRGGGWGGEGERGGGGGGEGGGKGGGGGGGGGKGVKGGGGNPMLAKWR